MDEKRNVLIESARYEFLNGFMSSIARSDVKDINELKQEDFDVFSGFYCHP